jgi:hypothetical protein
MTITTESLSVDVVVSSEMKCSFYGCENKESVLKIESETFFSAQNYHTEVVVLGENNSWSRYRDSQTVRKNFDSIEELEFYVNSAPDIRFNINRDDLFIWFWDFYIRVFCNEHTVWCHHCERQFPAVCITEINENPVCDDCRDDNYYFCDNCDEYNSDGCSEVQGDNWCEHCINGGGCMWCDYCQVYETDLCDSNFEQEDVDIWSSRNYEGIMNYNFKPSRPDFFMGSADVDDSRLFYGVELEVESMDNSMTDGMEIIKESLAELVYFKADGSLDRGYEAVTYPFTFNYYSEAIDFKFLSGLQELGYRSWSAGTCGLHVHISRTGFNSSGHIWKFAQLILSNQYAWSKLAGRSGSRWASFDLETNSVMKVLKGEKFPERYCAVNLCNADTIEVRIFRGSLNERRVRSAIESVDCAIQYAGTLSVHDINQGALKFGRFADWVNENRTECASFIDLMCEYGLIPSLKTAEPAEPEDLFETESIAHAVLMSEVVDNSRGSQPVLSTDVEN